MLRNTPYVFNINNSRGQKNIVVNSKFVVNLVLMFSVAVLIFSVAYLGVSKSVLVMVNIN